VNPPGEWDDLRLNFDAIERQLIFTGIGAPGMYAPPGAFYLNQATPGTAGQRIYFNTAEGVHWTGVV
jgi:hypothetical protein